jgi:cytochrome c oxidase accessory protein FixG
MATTQASAVHKKPLSWRHLRYYMYGLATIFAVGVPWITINGNHLFLLSFDQMKLNLAFVEFNVQQMYLMPFLLMFLFVSVFGMTVLGGRVFCGWLCPQTIFRVVYRDLIETKLLGLRKRIKNKQQEPDMSKPENKAKKTIALLIWAFLALLAASDFMWFFVPPQDFFRYLQDPMDHLVLIGFVVGIAAFLVYDVIFLKENFCVYVCPYSRIQSVLYDDDTVMAIYNPHRGGQIYDEKKQKLFTKQKDLQAVEPSAECTACESCVTVCPTHIDIRQGLQLECINCLECVDACTTVMGKLGKESLVVWSSEREILKKEGKTRYFRPKIIGYGIILVILVSIISVMGSKKEPFVLDLNRNGQAYSITRAENGEPMTKNSFVFLLQNTRQHPHKFYFSVIAPKILKGKIKIERPTEPFIVRPGIKKKKIVVLYTLGMPIDNPNDDTIVPITLKVYTTDTKKPLVIYRHTTFTFPRKDILLRESRE